MDFESSKEQEALVDEPKAEDDEISFGQEGE